MQTPPDKAYRPAAQGRQADEEVELAGEDVPPEQLVQAVASAADQLPALHGALTVVLLQKLPAAHAVQLGAPRPEYWPLLHGVQAATPVEIALYVPAAHDRHSDAELCSALAVVEVVPPASVRNVPAPQATQTDEPAALWYCPKRQTMHAAEPVDA